MRCARSALPPICSRKLSRDYVYVAYTYDADPAMPIPEIESAPLHLRCWQRHACRSLDLMTNRPAHNDHAQAGSLWSDQNYVSRGDNGGTTGSPTIATRTDRRTFHSFTNRFERLVGLHRNKILRMTWMERFPPTIRRSTASEATSFVRPSESAGTRLWPRGLLYSSEHGPGTDDEVNLIQAGQKTRLAARRRNRDDRGYVYTNGPSRRVCRALRDVR